MHGLVCVVLVLKLWVSCFCVDMLICIPGGHASERAIVYYDAGGISSLYKKEFCLVNGRSRGKSNIKLMRTSF